MKKQIIEHIEELKKYPQKILMLIGIIMMVVGIATAPEKVDHPIHTAEYSLTLYLGIIVAILGLFLYLRKIFNFNSKR